MVAEAQARRVLLAASASEGSAVRALFAGNGMPGWRAVDAQSLERAHSLQQLDPCDVVLLDSSLAGADPDSLNELTTMRRSPIVLLSDAEPATLRSYFKKGIGHWLPRRHVLVYPPLLAAVLHQAAGYYDLQLQLRQREEMLRDCQKQLDRLLEMLWLSIPQEGRPAWLSQRRMVERLSEEVQRSQRHGDPLTVVLAELTDGPGQPVSALPTDELGQWTARQVGKHKRRCDLAGQYGPHGFMMLLPHTSDRGAVEYCRRLRPLLENAEQLPAGAAAPLQVMFGIATYSTGTASVKGLLSRAEERLEQARDNPTEDTA
jgi:diguanylate cyclase (GGDEF)-like protein